MNSKKTYKSSQKPRIDIYGNGSTEKAELLFELLDEYGMKLLPWQRLVLRRWLAEDENGDFINLECGLSVPRQNGKTEIIVARIIYGIIFRGATGLFTAQTADTANTVKRRVQKFFNGNAHEEIVNLLTPRFREKERNYSYIEFTNGARYDFSTRTRMGGLGTTNDELIFDEAADVTDDHLSTLMPTASASKLDPQIIYCGTPPMASSAGQVYSRVRKQILGGKKGAWTEWGVEKLTDPEDISCWYASNPSLGYHLRQKIIEAECGSMSQDEFNHMRLGWWSGIEERRAIQQKAWDEIFEEKPDFDDSFKPVYAIKLSRDRDYSLAVALPLKDGRIHVEIIMQDFMIKGWSKLTKWLIDRWRDCSVIVIDGINGQELLIKELVDAKVPMKKIKIPNVKQVVSAHQLAEMAIEAKDVSHYNQPLLNQAVRATKKRPIGRDGGFGWESMSKNVTTSPIDAFTYAYWGQIAFQKKKTTSSEMEDNAKKWANVLGSI